MRGAARNGAACLRGPGAQVLGPIEEGHCKERLGYVWLGVAWFASEVRGVERLLGPIEVRCDAVRSGAVWRGMVGCAMAMYGRIRPALQVGRFCDGSSYRSRSGLLGRGEVMYGVAGHGLPPRSSVFSETLGRSRRDAVLYGVVCPGEAWFGESWHGKQASKKPECKSSGFN